MNKKIGFILSLKNKKTQKYSIMPIILDEDIVKSDDFDIKDYLDDPDESIVMVETYNSLKTKLVAIKKLANDNKIII